jgi:hypothetical protein
MVGIKLHTAAAVAAINSLYAAFTVLQHPTLQKWQQRTEGREKEKGNGTLKKVFPAAAL